MGTEILQFYADVTVMIDCALAARDYRSKMTVLAPQIKNPHSAARIPRIESDGGVERGGLCCVLCFVYD